MLCISQGRHFIGQAFHPDGILTTTSFHRAPHRGIFDRRGRQDRLDGQDINDKGIMLEVFKYSIFLKFFIYSYRFLLKALIGKILSI